MLEKLGKDFLELELAKVRLELDKEESNRQQTADLQAELENRTQTLQSELGKTRDRENRIMEDNKIILDKCCRRKVICISRTATEGFKCQI